MNKGLSGFYTEKILIQLDTEPQHFTYQPEVLVLNKFDVTSAIYITPIDLLLAQKIAALLLRKKSKGRDFIDIVFLLSKSVKPNYNYLQMKLGISSAQELRNSISEFCARTNMDEMAADVSPFLFYPPDEKKIRLFLPIVQQADLG